jgi:predicted nucleic acid-binding protein
MPRRFLKCCCGPRRPRRSRSGFLMWVQTLHAPHLIDIEVAQVLRRYAATGQIEPGRCSDALIDLSDVPLHRYPHDVLLPRVWELRHNLTAYDAVYVALAEALDAPLLTRDRLLAAGRGTPCPYRPGIEGCGRRRRHPGSRTRTYEPTPQVDRRQHTPLPTLRRGPAPRSRTSVCVSRGQRCWR